MKNIKYKLAGLFCLTFGAIQLAIALLSLTKANVAIPGVDMTIANALFEEINKDSLLNFSIFLGAYYGFKIGWRLIGMGATTKAEVDVSVLYNVNSISIDEKNSTVELNLENPLNGAKVVIKKETKYLAYFKNYIELNGKVMPGTFAKII